MGCGRRASSPEAKKWPFSQDLLHRPAPHPCRPNRGRRGRAAARLRARRRRASRHGHDPRPGRLAGAAARQRRARRGLRDGPWETDDLVALMRIGARELRHLDGLRGAVARLRGLASPGPPPRPRQHPRACPQPHLRPLRPRQRALRRLPRRADDVLLRLLPRGGVEPGGGAAGEAGADLRRACARPREPPAGDRQRLGRAGDPRRPRARLPGDDDDDLPRAARARRAARRRGGARGPGHGPLRGLPRPARAATTGWSRSR